VWCYLSLRKRVINAVYWSFFGHLSSNIIRLLSNLILTRLLMPEMFGLMSIVFVFISTIAMLTDTGIRPFIIKNKEHCSPKLVNTAWTLQIIRGLIVWSIIGLITFSLSYIQGFDVFDVDSVYSDPKLPIIIFVVGFASIISGFNSISIYLMDRELSVKHMIKITLFARITSTISMVLAAYFWQSVWVLVIGAMLNNLLIMISSHFLPGSNHKIFIDKAIALEILSFGKWIMLSTLMSMLHMNGDRIILSMFISTSQLGIYSIALLYTEAIRAIFSTLSVKIWFPVLSEINRDDSKEKIKQTYYKIRLYQDAITYFISGLIFAIAPILISILYDERYQEAGTYLSILALGLIGVNIELASHMLLSLGNSKAVSFINSIRTITLWILLFVLIKYFSLSVAIWAIALNFILLYPIMWYFLRKHGLLNIVKELRTIPILLLGIIIGNFISIFVIKIGF